MMRRRIVVLLMFMVAWGSVAAAQGRKPRLPPGRDPGGVAIAFLTTGVDYTRADISARLARDGEGDLIGWDMVDGDNRPFSRATDDSGSTFARELATVGRVRLVPVRIDPAYPSTIANGIAFAANTPARILLIPLWADQSLPWATIMQAAQRHPGLLLVAPTRTTATVIAPPDGANLVLVATSVQADADIIMLPQPQTDGLVPTSPASPAAALATLVTTIGHCISDPTAIAAADQKFRRLASQLKELAGNGGDSRTGSSACIIGRRRR